MDASIGYAISGNSPSTVTTATVGSVIDTASADGAGNGLGLDLVASIAVVYAGTGGTGGTLDLYLQTSPDNTTWTDLVHFAQIASGTASKQRAVSSRWLTQNPAAVGQGTTPLLAASTAVGAPQRYLRLVAKTGTGTTAGAAQALTIIATGPRKAS